MPTYRIIYFHRRGGGSVLLEAPTEAVALESFCTLCPEAQVISCQRDHRGEVNALKAQLYDLLAQREGR